MDKNKEKLNKVIVDTVDEELKKIFGETAALVIYGYLDNNLSLKREKIPEKIELFSQGLDEFFGSGAYMLEKTILTNLYSNFGFSYKEKKDYTFVDYVTELKNHLSVNNNKHS
jgi:hypothetical protein